MMNTGDIKNFQNRIVNAVQDLTNHLNKQLLPSLPKQEDKVKIAEKRTPQGWLENHLEDLDCAVRLAEQIYDQVTRLVQATKTESKIDLKDQI